jgi:hypothetical protein
MKGSMGEINKAIRDLRSELKDVHGDANIKKQYDCTQILNRLSFHVNRKLLFDTKPEYQTNDITLKELTKGT